MILFPLLLLSVLTYEPSSGKQLTVSEVSQLANLTRGFQSCKLKTGLISSECDELTDDDINTDEAPDELDWTSAGLVRPVRNQRKCGTSWAFALLGNIEGQYIKNAGKKTDLSVQELIDCILDCNGCDEYCNSDTAMSALAHCKAGIEAESDYRYRNKASNQDCKFDANKEVTVVQGCVIYNLQDEDKLKEVLYQVGPLYVVLNGKTLLKYTKGILKHCPGGGVQDLTHAVLLTGYGSENGVDYWIIKNSWGTAWGENGYARIKRGVNACGLMNPEIASITLQDEGRKH